jgi:hypothetical protein
METQRVQIKGVLTWLLLQNFKSCVFTEIIIVKKGQLPKLKHQVLYCSSQKDWRGVAPEVNGDRGGYKEMSSILADQYRPNAGGGELGGSCGVSANERVVHRSSK